MVYAFSSAEGWSNTVCCWSGNNGKHTKDDIRVTCHSAEAFLSKPQDLSPWVKLPVSALHKGTMAVGQNCYHIKSLSKWIWIYNACANGKGPRLEYKVLSDWTWTHNLGSTLCTSSFTHIHFVQIKKAEHFKAVLITIFLREFNEQRLKCSNFK